MLALGADIGVFGWQQPRLENRSRWGQQRPQHPSKHQVRWRQEVGQGPRRRQAKAPSGPCWTRANGASVAEAAGAAAAGAAALGFRRGPQGPGMEPNLSLRASEPCSERARRSGRVWLREGLWRLDPPGMRGGWGGGGAANGPSILSDSAARRPRQAAAPLFIPFLPTIAVWISSLSPVSIPTHPCIGDVGCFLDQCNDLFVFFSCTVPPALKSAASVRLHFLSMYLEVLACVDPKLGAHITAMHVAKKATLWVVEDAQSSSCTTQQPASDDSNEDVSSKRGLHYVHTCRGCDTEIEQMHSARQYAMLHS